MLDAIVIGGGPVGSRVACQLARMGHSVAVLEQKENLGERVCCTGIVSLECLKSFAIDDKLVQRTVNGARLYSPSGRILELHREKPVACILERSVLNVFMAKRAEEAGMAYLLGGEAIAIEFADDGVRVRINHKGKMSCLKARAAVIASGSSIKLLRESLPGKDYDFVTGVQAEVESPGTNEIEVYFGNKVAPGFFAWLVPTQPGKALVGLLSRHGASGHLKRLLSKLKAEGEIASDEVDISYRSIALKSDARTYGERMLVVGGAAAQVKPTTGGGIYYGLLCADIAANNLHYALENDDLSSESLASYEKEWKNKLGQELTTGYYLRKFYEHLNDRQIDTIFQLATSLGFSKTLLKEDILSFDWHGSTVSRLLEHNIIGIR